MDKCVQLIRFRNRYVLTTDIPFSPCVTAIQPRATNSSQHTTRMTWLTILNGGIFFSCPDWGLPFFCVERPIPFPQRKSTL